MLPSSTIQETAGAQPLETRKDQATLLQQLTTESQNEASQGFDTKSALEIARIINHEDAKVAAAVKKAIPEIAQVIDQVARCLREGFQGSSCDVEALSFPRFRCSFDGLEFAGSEEPRATLLGGSAGHMRHAFKPHPPFGAEHLKT